MSNRKNLAIRALKQKMRMKRLTMMRQEVDEEDATLGGFIVTEEDKPVKELSEEEEEEDEFDDKDEDD
jgi:hypothetical protein